MGPVYHHDGNVTFALHSEPIICATNRCHGKCVHLHVAGVIEMKITLILLSYD